MKIKEGGGMDLQKENNLIQEAFEVEADEAGFCLDQKWGDYENPYESSDTALAFNLFKKGWQASKDQAVPEGFVLVPKEPTDEIIEAMNEFDYRNDYSDMDGAYRTIVETLEKAQAVPDQLDVNSILHDIDCYFDNGLSNTERTANNLLQSIYEKLSGEVKAQEPAND